LRQENGYGLLPLLQLSASITERGWPFFSDVQSMVPDISATASVTGIILSANRTSSPSLSPAVNGDLYLPREEAEYTPSGFQEHQEIQLTI
jgi:hypothetical protein